MAKKLTARERAEMLQKERGRRGGDDEPVWKSLVSRLVLLGVGVAMIVGGWRLLGVQSTIDADPTTEQIRGADGPTRTAARSRGTAGVVTRLPLIGAVLLFAVGGVICVAAVTPISLAQRFVTPA